MIKVGDRVEVIDDPIFGTVTQVLGTAITIVDSDGFTFQFETAELILSPASKAIESAVLKTDIAAVKQEKASVRRPKSITTKPKERHRPTFEVDLHIEQLTTSAKGMSNFDMLNLQCDTARRQLEFAIKKRIPKMVFIHGVGAGVLRQELNTLFSRYDNIQFYDADYKIYGHGATEVRLIQRLNY